MAGVVRRDGLREVRDQIARTLVEAGCNDPWHVVYRCAYALIEARVLDAVPDTGWRFPTAAELDARVEAMTPAERAAGSWRDGYRTGYYEHALGHPNRLHPDTLTADAVPDVPPTEDLELRIAELPVCGCGSVAYIHHRACPLIQAVTDLADALICARDVALVIHAEADALDGGFVSSVVGAPGCISQGETAREAVVNVLDALDEIGADAVPDVPPDPPAVDRDELARWFENELTHDAFTHKTDEELADALLSSGVLVDAAVVRARALEDAADAFETQQRALTRAGELHLWVEACDYLRDRAVSEREGTSRPPADTDIGRGR